MQFRVLGPLEVVDQGNALPLGGGRQLALFALLLLNANKVVSTDRLVDELWTEPPPTAEKIVRNYVSLLRKQLGGRVARQSPGYLLRVEPGELDSEQFETLVQEARDQEPAVAAKTLREALALWRGPALAQVAYEPFAQRAIASVEDLRLQALEDRIDADLELGHAREVVPELEQLVHDQPLRERPRALLMLALYRSGRQADALDAYQDTRRTLVDELGLEPSPALQEMQRKILAHDEALAGPEAPRATSRRRRGALMIAIGGIVLLGAGIAAGVVELTGSSAARLTAVAPKSVGVIDPRTNAIVAQIPLGTPVGLFAGDGSVWAGDGTTLFRLDTKKCEITMSIAAPEGLTGAAAFAGAVWALRSVRGSEAVSRLDLRYPWLVRTVRTGTDHFDNDGLAAGEGAIWVAHGGLILRPDTLLTRIDPATGKVTGRLAAGAAGGLAVGAGSVWLAQAAYALTRVDAKTLSVVTTVTLGTTAAPVAVSVGEGAVWVASRVGVPCPPGMAMPGSPPATQCQSTKFGTVSRIDPATNSVTATIRVPGVPDAVLAAGGGVWVASESTRTILRIDPKTTRIVARIPTGSRPGSLAAADDGTIWVAAS